STVTAAVGGIVIQVMAASFETETNVMLRSNQPEVLRADERGVMHKERPRVGVTAVNGVAGYREHRSPAFANVLPIGPRNSERVQSVLLAIKDTGDVLTLPGPAQDCVP